MIGSLARKRTNVVALATLLALVAAMFVALAPTSAQAAGISLGTCVEWPATPTATTGDTNTNYIAVGDWCEIPDITDGTEPLASSNAAVVAAPTVDDNSDAERLTALSVGVTQVTVGTTSYRISVIEKPTVIVHIADSDNIVSNEDDAPSVFIIGRGFADDQLPAAGTGITVTTGGIYFDATNNNTSFSSAVNAATTATTANAVTGRTFPVTRSLVISSAADGDYVISATVPDEPDDSDVATTERKAVTGKATLTVGDPGTSPASALLVLSNEVFDNPTTADDESVAETGSTPRNGSINLYYKVSNSLGNEANGSDLSEIKVIAPKGVETALGKTNFMGDSTATPPTSTTASGVFSVSSEDDEARSVTVKIIAIGDDGVAESEAVTLTFTGGTDSIELAGPSDSLHDEATKTAENNDNRDKTAFVLSTLDSAGNKIDNPTNLVYRITAPNGDSVDTESRIVPLQTDLPTSKAGSNDLILLTSKGSASNPLAKGEYTLKVSSGANSVEATFTVADKADSISVEVDDDSPDTVGQIITATITVSDENGVNVADDTVITVIASDVAAGSDRVLVRTSAESVKTKAGVAEATFAVVGSGSSVITASVGGASGVQVINSTAGSSDTAEAEEVTLDCLSETAGFATYTCGVDSSASELFALVSGRGATAIHLWNGSAWVRYSVVNGNEVPGSTDFLVTDNDILYVSN